MRSATSDQKAEGRHELERAIALMRETGAMLFEAFINVTSVERNAGKYLLGPVKLLTGYAAGNAA